MAQSLYLEETECHIDDATLPPTTSSYPVPFLRRQTWTGWSIIYPLWRPTFRYRQRLLTFSHVVSPRSFFHKATWYGALTILSSPNLRTIPASAYTPLVFAHHNLTPKNILLDDHGVVWLINWSRAGFYPSWSEYLGIQFGADIYSHTKSWKYCVKYMTQPDFQVEKCMREMGFCTTGYLIWDRSRQSTLYILVQGPVQMLSIHLLVAHSTFKDQ